MNLIIARPVSGNESKPSEHASKSIGGIRPTNGRRTLYRDFDDGITIERDFSVDSELFHDVCKVRNNSAGTEEFSFDRFSYHYCLFVGGEPVGSLTSTAEAGGAMDCREMYPQQLLSAHEDTAFSPCKFSILRNRFSSFRLMRLMVREYWRDQLSLGGRLAVMNARIGLVPFYQRMGFLVIAGSQFDHPYCGTQSVSLVLPADPNLKSFFSDLFEAVDDPTPLDEVTRYCDIMDQASFRQASHRQPNLRQTANHC